VNDQSRSPAPSGIAIENNRTITVPVEQIIVGGERRPINEAKVTEMMESINRVSLLSPIIVALRKAQDGGEDVRLVAGLHRLEATKRLGIASIQCTVLERNEDLRVELAEIDENIVRNNPSVASCDSVQTGATASWTENRSRRR
jgi:ParB-like chromosome segregation protein Spo0J